MSPIETFDLEIRNWLKSYNQNFRLSINKWFERPEIGFQIYLRLGYRVLEGKEMVLCLQVANVGVAEPYCGKGIFTDVLSRLETIHSCLLIENVLNPRLAAFLKRRGYIEEKNHGIPGVTSTWFRVSLPE